MPRHASAIYLNNPIKILSLMPIKQSGSYLTGERYV
ncbi:hypothetical protein EPIR_2169 [Erwinia piriflorinigrans CFBP 5888]|uniref:Uncharacterized protein n=1 Tax=Erwinia piriflorinigrans CFBP 5888 TaxID=1161919 RepID=V5Z8J3_9GAMM|nr:hypothetical protein EPIR_2169 [Erwinia piriflorinigrans CFBP 5888]